MYCNNDYRDYLSHHGILGMHWGRRNGPPYPLGAGDHSASENKDGWRKSLGGGKNEKLYERNRRKDSLRQYKQELEDRHDKALPKENAERRELAKKIVIASAVTVGVGAGLYLAYKSGCINQMSQLGKDLTPSSAKAIMKKYIKNLPDPQEIERELHANDFVLKKGTEIHRMTATANIDFSKVTDATYVAHDPKDVAKYMTQLKDWSGTGERFDVTFKAVQDIRMPSKETARKIFDELWENDPTYKDELRSVLTETYEELLKKEYPKMTYEKVKKTAKDFADFGLDDPENAFQRGIYTIVRRQSDSKKLLSKYAEHGYNAIEDYFDKGVFTDSPVILFNPSTSVVKVGEQKVTESMKKLAAMKYGLDY